MKVIFIAIMLSLTGCGVSTHANYIKWATDVCKNNDGINHIINYAIVIPNVMCNNGAEFRGTTGNTERYFNNKGN